MTQQEIIDGNKIIGVFDGWYQKDLPKNGDLNWFNEKYSTKITSTLSTPSKPENFKYHSSWDWLMPVVEKIRTIEDWDVQIGLIGGDGNFCKIERHSIASPNFRGYCKDGKSFLEPTYTAVIQFIQWYNQQK